MPPTPSTPPNDDLIEQRLRLLEQLPTAIHQSLFSHATPVASLDNKDLPTASNVNQANEHRAPPARTNPTGPTHPHSPPDQDQPRGGDSGECDLIDTASHRLASTVGDITVTGTAMLGRCPQCQAPLTIRTWLALADCWRCETSIAVNEIIIDDTPPTPIAPMDGTTPPAAVAAPTPTVATPIITTPPIGTADSPNPRAAAPDAARLPAMDELHALTIESVVANAARWFFSLSPAWIVSILLHLILLMILGLIALNSVTVPDTIVLSVDISPNRHTGQGIQIDTAPENTASPLPPSDHRAPAPSANETPSQDTHGNGAVDADADNAGDDNAGDDGTNARSANRTADASQKTDTDRTLQALVNQLTFDRTASPTAGSRALPDINQVKSAIAGRTNATPFSARDARLRSAILRSEGGTLLTEAAVARGLRWLASVQNTDGSWSLKNYARHASAKNKGDCMGTALALLPFLGAGQTHEWGIYQKTVAKGLNWMIRNQKPDGDLRAGLRTEAGMYSHGQATIVLCETLAMTGDQQFRTPAQRAIDFITAAQGTDGGWRYRPGQTGDTSMLGWQMMALQSAKLSGMNLQVDPDTLAGAGRFLDSVSVRRKSGFTSHQPAGTFYGYQRNRPPTEVMTAEALLCRMYLGATRDDARVAAAVKWMSAKQFPSRKKKNVYYWYYGSQVMHHYGGRHWRNWNQQVRTLLLESQQTDGQHAGSWNRQGFRWGSQGGRIYTTALATCTLEVYYRHLPLFRKINL